MVDGTNRWHISLYYSASPSAVILTTLFIRIMDTFRVFDDMDVNQWRPRNNYSFCQYPFGERSFAIYELWIQFGYVSFSALFNHSYLLAIVDFYFHLAGGSLNEN